MDILFLHRNFPGQFKHLCEEFTKDPNNNVVFITSEGTIPPGKVKKITYIPNQQIPDNCHPYLKNYTEAVIHGQSCASVAVNLKGQGFNPDIIFGFSGWGNSMFMKDVFPDVPFLSYYEWYYNSDSADVAYSGLKLTDDDKARARCKNSKLLIDLYTSDAGICPTHWQRSQFPKEFHDKIKVIHDGIDTDTCKPDENAKFFIPDKNLELTTKDEVITYVARGFEPYRGFPQFMEAAAILLKKRPNAHIVIAGEDVVCYGQKLEHGSYKQYMLQKLKLDMNRVHFVDKLSYENYIKLLQVSSAHIYLTFPYVLSWSILEAMSVGCCVVASNTEPVVEIIKNNHNGLLAEFFNIEHIIKRVLYALENKDKMQEIRKNARQTIIDNYNLKDMLQKQINYINSLIKQ